MNTIVFGFHCKKNAKTLVRNFHKNKQTFQIINNWNLKNMLMLENNKTTFTTRFFCSNINFEICFFNSTFITNFELKNSFLIEFKNSFFLNYFYRFNTIFKSFIPIFENNLKINDFKPITLKINQKFIFFTFLDGFDNTTSHILVNNINPQEFDKQMLSLADRTFWHRVTKPGFYFSSLEDLFEDEDIIPFWTNEKFEKRVYVDYDFTKKFDIGYRWATSDILSSFYYEPFFFFWGKIEQSLEDFWLISFFWERCHLLDERIFWEEEEISKRKVIFLPLADLFHKSELKSGLKIFKRLYSYKAKQLFSNYLNFDDPQDYAIDKNFVHIWNYWIGAKHQLNLFGPNNWTGWINFYREKLYTPQAHVPSKYYRSDSAFMSHNSRNLNFAFFPDLVMMWGHLNSYYDMYTSGYNRFFHFGETFMDTTISLKLLRYQLTINYWGEFEYLVQDFASYQPTYFSDPIATVRLPMILLVSKKYTSPGNMNVYIRDYNTVFQFKKYTQYSIVKGDVLFPLSVLERLELLRDVAPIDQRLHSYEWVVNVYFGYNQSEVVMNYPSWFPDFLDTTNFYFSTFYDYEEDKNLEEKSKDLVSSLYQKNYNYNSSVSIYFNNMNLGFSLRNLFFFINEKLFDDPGHIITTISRNENFQKFNKLNWLGLNSLIHFEFIPAPHFNWKITILGQNFFDWRLFQISEQYEIALHFAYTINNTFSFGFKNLPTTNLHWWIHRPIFTLSTTINPILYLEIQFLPILRFLKILLGSTRLDSYFILFFKELDNFLNLFPNPFYFYYLSTILFKIDEIFDPFFNMIEIKKNYIYQEYKEYFTNPYFLKFKLFFLDIINLGSFFFLHYHATSSITKIYYIIDGNFKVSYHSQIKIKFEILPLEFFLIGSMYDEPNYLNSKIFISSYSDFLPFLALTYFWNFSNFEDFQNFVLLWMNYQLNKDILNKIENYDYINAINEIDNWTLKINSLEYERYKNYVLKHTLYKSI